ncbi:arginine--tRNA ligase [Ferruginivarius sediminum]|uniref:Arginine--tRNA ligase n=1 Tax=Ferruginivarius sediminum TaxID=2661937 RepID=A0A369TE72_9PROT|nr:arginine--tRNA ligase [Ferruginivarius sediminum]RDD62854.1 arginine--tRNA ligase [Ferruginivarius sediminum]
MTTSLLATLRHALRGAFETAGFDPETVIVETSRRPELGQFQCNSAMQLAKTHRTKPRDIAERLVAALGAVPFITDLAIAGPGFVNFNLTDEFLAVRANDMAGDARLGFPKVEAPAKVVIDYGGPNVAKPMHVGHLRASIIGEALKRIMRFRGHDVVGDVHLGDWGLPIGMLIHELSLRQPGLPYFDAAKTEGFPEESPVTIDDLEEMYPAAVSRCRENDDDMQAARRKTAELQNGRPGYIALWRHFMQTSRASQAGDFDRLGVSFDLWRGESDVADLVQPLVRDLQARGIAEVDQGAILIRFKPAEDDGSEEEGEGDEEELTPLILVTSDGTVTYAATDLATIQDRVARLSPDLSLYVVDSRQGLHFRQVFEAAQRAGLNDGMGMEHIGFGTVNGPDGKPLKTRSGGVPRLGDLLDQANEEAGKRLAEHRLGLEFGEAERADIAHKVGLAAIKFADLNHQRTANYAFDLANFTRFEGKTGPYLLYTVVRLNSVLAKGGGVPADARFTAFSTQVERDLLIRIATLPEVLKRVEERRAPNVLCDFAYDLAQQINAFYHEVPVNQEPDPGRRAHLTLLVDVSARALTLVLELLGIEVPARM